MTKKKAAALYEPEGDPVPDELKEKIEVESEPKPLYLPVKWAGVLDTFQCQVCQFCEPDRETMILHVLNHFPAGEQDALLAQLLKE